MQYIFTSDGDNYSQTCEVKSSQGDLELIYILTFGQMGRRGKTKVIGNFTLFWTVAVCNTEGVCASQA